MTWKNKSHKVKHNVGEPSSPTFFICFSVKSSHFVQGGEQKNNSISVH
jgi:hypothetical protein